MEFNVKRASDGLCSDFIETVSINTIEELQGIANKYKGINPEEPFSSWSGDHELIIDFKEQTITVYDSYVE